MGLLCLLFGVTWENYCDKEFAGVLLSRSLYIPSRLWLWARQNRPIYFTNCCRSRDSRRLDSSTREVGRGTPVTCSVARFTRDCVMFGSLLVRGSGLQEWAAIAEKGEFADTEDSMLGAKIERGYVHETISRVGHERDNRYDRILVRTAKAGLYQKNVRLAK